MDPIRDIDIPSSTSRIQFSYRFWSLEYWVPAVDGQDTQFTPFIYSFQVNLRRTQYIFCNLHRIALKSLKVKSNLI